jgi:acid stress-induced BolA-like protein IbaG/YrbA
MAAPSKKRLQEILTKRLHLYNPLFRIEKEGQRLFGSIISRSFKGKGDFKRQDLIHKALEAELGPDASRYVGMLLAYTPDEWFIDEQVAAGR